MKITVLLASLLLFASTVNAFVISPVIKISGQALMVSCDPKTETFCQELCGVQESCTLPETFCRSCAGTESLKLKRILDATGTALVAQDPMRTTDVLLKTLRESLWVSLSSTTLYNYSSGFDSDQLRAQFTALCPNLPDFSPLMGTLLIGLNPVDHTVAGVLGAICPNQMTGSMDYFPVTSRWQIQK